MIERKLAGALAKPAAEKRFRLAVAEAEAEADALVAQLRNGGRVVVAGSFGTAATPSAISTCW